MEREEIGFWEETREKHWDNPHDACLKGLSIRKEAPSPKDDSIRSGEGKDSPEPHEREEGTNPCGEPGKLTLTRPCRKHLPRNLRVAAKEVLTQCLITGIPNAVVSNEKVAHFPQNIPFTPSPPPLEEPLSPGLLLP